MICLQWRIFYDWMVGWLDMQLGDWVILPVFGALLCACVLLLLLWWPRTATLQSGLFKNNTYDKLRLTPEGLAMFPPLLTGLWSTSIKVSSRAVLILNSNAGFKILVSKFWWFLRPEFFSGCRVPLDLLSIGDTWRATDIRTKALEFIHLKRLWLSIHCWMINIMENFIRVIVLNLTAQFYIDCYHIPSLERIGGKILGHWDSFPPATLFYSLFSIFAMGGLGCCAVLLTSRSHMAEAYFYRFKFSRISSYWPRLV